MDRALEEAEQRLKYLEKDQEEIDPITREKIVNLYANFIRYAEGLSDDISMIMKNHFLLFERYIEFQQEVEKLIGLTRLEELFGPYNNIAPTYESQQYRMQCDYGKK